MDENALDTLSQIAQLAAQMAEQNRLKDDELKIQRQEAENKARELDLQAQAIALERERLNRAEARVQLFIQQIAEGNAKTITMDDAFGETVQRTINGLRLLVSAHIDVEKAVLALLSQNSIDIRESRLASPKRIEKLRLQELLLEHQNTLHNLQLQQASYGTLDTPVKITRQIDKTQQAIEEIEEKLQGE